MFRIRMTLAALVVLAILPLVGCANRRCCSSPSYSARPAVVEAAPCSSCPNAGGPPPLVVGQ
jgi:hypothetical protein